MFGHTEIISVSVVEGFHFSLSFLVMAKMVPATATTTAETMMVVFNVCIAASFLSFSFAFLAASSLSCIQTCFRVFFLFSQKVESLVQSYRTCEHMRGYKSQQFTGSVDGTIY